MTIMRIFLFLLRQTSGLGYIFFEVLGLEVVSRPIENKTYSPGFVKLM